MAILVPLGLLAACSEAQEQEFGEELGSFGSTLSVPFPLVIVAGVLVFFALRQRR